MLLTQEQMKNVQKILITPCNVQPPGPFNFVLKLLGPTGPFNSLLGYWGKWKRRFLRYLQEKMLRSLTDQDRIDLLMFLIGKERDEFHLQLSRMGLTEQHNFSEVIKRVDEHFKMLRSVTYRRFHFNNRDQLEGESINEYVTALKRLADVCEYGHLRDEMVRDRLIAGIVSENARQDMLDHCEHLSLDQAIWIVHCDELKGRRRQGF